MFARKACAPRTRLTYIWSLRCCRRLLEKDRDLRRDSLFDGSYLVKSRWDVSA